MKRPWSLLCLTLGVILLASGFTSQLVSASQPAQQGPNLPRGAALYDKWYAVTGQQPPETANPLWSRQNSSNRAGPDTWRCVTCHGWDYLGKDGAYKSGSFFTGFPGVYQLVQGKSEQEIIDHLNGKLDPLHNFSKYLDEASLRDLAGFLKNGLIDDSQYIDPRTLETVNGDETNGKQLYNQACAKCHGDDGTTIRFKYEGIDATLGTLAQLDPWRFLHKTRFGTPGTPMPIGFDLGWKPQDGRDVLAYAQNFPSGLEKSDPGPIILDRPIPTPGLVGGPASNLWTGLLTIAGAMITALGINILAFGALVGIILLLVWALRGRSK
jgi:thiosulfate dehydrogenase